MSSYAQRTRALMAAALFAVALAFGLAFAMSSTAQAEGGDSQDAPLTAQADLQDGIYKLPDFKSGPSSNFNHFVADESYLVVNGDSATIVFTTDGSTASIGKYNRFALGKASELVEGDYPATLKKDAPVFYGVPAGKGSTASKWSFEITLAKTDILAELEKETSDPDNAGIFIVGWNNEKSGWYKSSKDQKLTLTANGQLGAKVENTATTYTLDKITNHEKMFKVTSAKLVDNAIGLDQLTFTLSGSSYPYAYSGSQDDAVKTAGLKNEDPNWAAIGAGNSYTIPVVVTGGKFSPDVVMLAGTNKAGEITDPNYHARSFAIDTGEKSIEVNNASDTAALTVESTVEDIPAGSGSIDYTGYVRPYAGATLNESNPLSNNWASTLTIDLGENSIYDKGYAVTYQGTPWLGEDAAAKDPADGDIATVTADHKLAIPVSNDYDAKTAQLNGNIIKVMMHVKADADSPNKDQWLERTFKLDFTNRTTATLAISDSAKSVMYRLYNPNSGEHFYTADAAERDAVAAAGWNYEGTAWTAPVKSATPVYRVYSGTDHHYTMDEEEKNWLVNDIGWSDEGVGWYSDDAKGVPLYRVFNPNVDPAAAFNNSGSHHYTTNAEERDALVSVGWQDEGIAWYGVK